MKIKELRESKGLTQSALASMLEVTRSSVAMWETGRSLPRAEMLLKLSKIFGESVDTILQQKAT